MLNSKILIKHKKFTILLIYFCHHQSFFLLKNIKVAFQNIFNVIIVLSTVFNLKLSSELKVDPKTFTLKTLEEISQKKKATQNKLFLFLGL